MARTSVLLCALCALCGCQTATPPAADGPWAEWPFYGGDAGGTRYSPLTEINRDNVRRLRVAWTYRHGDVAETEFRRTSRKTSFEATPILVDGTLYFTTPFNRVIALDPRTGARHWSYDPGIDLWIGYGDDLINRGVATWVDTKLASGQPCRRRIYEATNDNRLIAVDAATGAPCAGFGQDGQVDLAREAGFAYLGEYHMTSPPAVVGDVVMVGSAISDNQRAEAPSGVVRGFDARTGARLWSWDPAPRGEQVRTGAANAWSIFSADHERDLVFVPTGSASPDFYGGLRPGPNLYADSVVALRASTGRMVWHFQTVHHDLWDYDVPAQPVLVTVRRGGREIPAVAQATKTGLLFLLHRETGQPLFPVEERPVPRSDVPGEQPWPTQPFPTLPRPLVPQKLSPDDAWGLTPWDRAVCRQRMAALRSEGIFTPPSVKGTVIFPGNAGGTNWGSAAFDPQRGLLVLNTSRLAHVVTLIPRDKWNAEVAAHRDVEISRQSGTPFAMRREALLSPLGLPCNPPPWGTLVAVDLATGALRWEVNLGTTRDLAARKIGLPFALNWGTPSMGGPIVTAGGLVFIAAAMDDYLRAFDVETGRELWKGRLPAGGQATPMTYRLPHGRQYVVIAAGGHSRMGTRLGDEVVAFALP